MYRLCALPNNPLPIYGKDARRGMLSFEEGRTHRMKITLGDDCKNRSTLAFDVRRSETDRTDEEQDRPSGIPVRWHSDYRYGG